MGIREFLVNITNEAKKISEKEFETKSKGNENDLVTNLDLEIEKYLITKIKEQYPEFDIVSEEFNGKEKITENCFIIDPIDGTINFANNIPLWGIQVACVMNNKTVASVINVPKLNEVYSADEEGAYLNEEKIEVKEVPIKNAVYAVDGVNIVPKIERMINYTKNKRHFGAVCISLAFMASGKTHGVILKNDRPWDYAPGMYLCKMAGAKTKTIGDYHLAAMNEEFLNILEEQTKITNKKNIIILHSLNGDTKDYWGKDIKEVFEKYDTNVIIPDFPIRENSKYEEFKKILLPHLNDTLTNNSIVIAHSIGNPYFMRFCEETNYIPSSYIAVAPGAVYNYPSKRNDYIVEVKNQAYSKEEHLNYIKNNLKDKYCIYSDEDDNNKEKFERFIEDTNATPMYLKYYNHFDGYHKIYKIPELTDLLEKILEI